MKDEGYKMQARRKGLNMFVHLSSLALSLSWKNVGKILKCGKICEKGNFGLVDFPPGALL